jgi:hypothetical protein
MKTWLIFKKVNNGLELTRSYESEIKKDDVEFWDYSLVSPLAVHLEVPDGLDKDCVSPQVDENGEWKLIESTERTEQKRSENILKIEQKKIEKEELRISLGIKAKAYLGYLCEENGYTESEYFAMLSDDNVLLVNQLLLNGALEASKKILLDYPANDYLTREMIDLLITKLDIFIFQVQNF